jgi:hypothetical protein
VEVEEGLTPVNLILGASQAVTGEADQSLLAPVPLMDLPFRVRTGGGGGGGGKRAWSLLAMKAISYHRYLLHYYLHIQRYRQHAQPDAPLQDVVSRPA